MINLFFKNWGFGVKQSPSLPKSFHFPVALSHMAFKSLQCSERDFNCACLTSKLVVGVQQLQERPSFEFVISSQVSETFDFWGRGGEFCEKSPKCRTS